MQEGIGRGGYRILAVVFLLVGLLGAASLLVAVLSPGSTAVLLLGLTLTPLGLGVLFAIALRGLTGVPEAGRSAPAGLAPKRMLDVEYLDAEDAPEEVADAAREPVPVQPNRNLTRDTKGWPQRKGPSGVTRGEARKAANGPAIPIEFKATAARVVPMESARAPLEPPTVLAREVARNAKVPDGMAKGQCGTCDAILLAPKVRPLKLRCPKCQKVTALS